MENVSIPEILVIAGILFIFVSRVKIGGKVTIEHQEGSPGLLFSVGCILVVMGLIIGAMHLIPTEITEYSNGTKVSIYNTNFDLKSFFTSKSEIVEVTQLAQINSSLQKGPVFLNIGSKMYPPCQAMNPILNELSKEYAGNITIMHIDRDKNPNLTEYFKVAAIPDSSVIVGIENNEYVYMQEDGNISKDRSNAKILDCRSKQDLEKILDLVVQKENAKSNKGILIPKL